MISLAVPIRFRSCDIVTDAKTKPTPYPVQAIMFEAKNRGNHEVIRLEQRRSADVLVKKPENLTD